MTPQRAIGMVEILTALEAEAAGLAARRMTVAERTGLREIHAVRTSRAHRQHGALHRTKHRISPSHLRWRTQHALGRSRD